MTHFFLIFFFLLYWCCYPHRLRESVSPVCWVFNDTLCMSHNIWMGMVPDLVQKYFLSLIIHELQSSGNTGKQDILIQYLYILRVCPILMGPQPVHNYFCPLIILLSAEAWDNTGEYYSPIRLVLLHPHQIGNILMKIITIFQTPLSILTIRNCSLNLPLGWFCLWVTMSVFCPPGNPASWWTRLSRRYWRLLVQTKLTTFLLLVVQDLH